MNALRDRRLRGWRFAALAVLIGVSMTSAACAQVPAPRNGGQAAPRGGGDREPFDAPMTPQERRWLMDQYERQRFQQVSPTNERIDVEIGAPADLLRHFGPEIQKIQQELGGSVVDQFPALRSDEQRSRDSGNPSGERGARERRATIEALRDAAWQLDTSANRLERLELYRQADALREQAQRLRLDARGMIHTPQQRGAGLPGQPARLGAQPEPASRPQPELAPAEETEADQGAPRPR